MILEEAFRIYDPATSQEALAPYACDCALREAVTEEACTTIANAIIDIYKEDPVWTIEEFKKAFGRYK